MPKLLTKTLWFAVAILVAGCPRFSEPGSYAKSPINQQVESIKINPQLPVMIVDDMCKSKLSMHHCKTFVQNAGLTLYKNTFVIVDRNDHPNHGQTVGMPPTISLFKAWDFLRGYDEYVKHTGRLPMRWGDWWKAGNGSGNGSIANMQDHAGAISLR